MTHGRVSRFLFYRLLFLFVGNLALLAAIRFFLKEGVSFSDVLMSSGFHVAPTLLAALGMTGIICCGAIDLSIGAVIAVAGTTFGILVEHQAPPVLCYLCCSVVAWVLSMTNGYLIRSLRIPAIIITLAGLTVYRGLALILADVSIDDFSGNISVESDYRGPEAYSDWILILVVAAALVWEWFAETPRRWLALGNSHEAFRLQGLAPRKALQSAFFVGGLFLGCAALLEVSRRTAIEPARLTVNFELKVIGAVVLGGTNIFGGEGSYVGTVLAVFFLYFLEQTLTLGNVSEYYRHVLIGGTIIVVIGMDCFLHRHRKRLEELR